MKKRWLTVLATTLLLSSGCDVAPSELDGLSPANAEAYIVLSDQLKHIQERLAPSLGGRLFCVTIRSVDDTEGVRVDPILIARLQSHAPADLRAVLVPASSCRETSQGMVLQSGEPALGLFAFFGPLSADKWSAGYGCGGLCGEGNEYAIYHIFGYPLAIRTGHFIS